MKTMRSFLVALVMTLSAVAAHAADLGTLGPSLSFATTSLSPGLKSFAEFISFTIDSPSVVFAQVSGVGAAGKWALFDTDLHALSGTFALGAYDNFSLASGDYLIGVSLKPLFAGGYAIAAAGAIAAVPEPETYALFFAGLGMIIAISRRRLRH